MEEGKDWKHMLISAPRNLIVGLTKTIAKPTTIAASEEVAPTSRPPILVTSSPRPIPDEPLPVVVEEETSM